MDYAGANGFSFPVLTRSELLQCTDELKVDVTEEDINKPCTQRVLLIYDFFTDLLMGFTRDSFTQLSFRAQQQFNGQHDEQIYQDAIGLVSYFKQLRKLMADVGVDDFTMKDILRPDGQRFRRCLSALINFAKFREERFALFEEHTLRTEQMVAKKEKVEQKLAEMREKVNAIRAERAAQEPQAQALRDTNSALTADLRELKKHQTALTAEAEALKKEKTDLSDKLSKTQMAIMNLNQDCVRLKSRIVQSPEMLKAAIVDMSNAVQTEKSVAAQTERRARELQEKLNMMGLVEQEIGACLKLMNECEKEKIKSEQAKQKVANDRDSVDKKKTEIRELELRAERLRRQLLSAKEKLTRLEKHQSVKNEAISSKLAQLKEEYRIVALERAEAQVKADDHEKTRIATEHKADELRKQETSDAAEIEDLITKLHAQVNIFQNALEMAMVPPV
ncbi:Nuf2 family-domain-containing protein [Gaertneriomyces semiglobifer]|nr:Nuf2 family-domain-containing protein [Gaertneriomyces semiglobifer]